MSTDPFAARLVGAMMVARPAAGQRWGDMTESD